ncbi:MAG: aldehyde ferredoxin oxidoreductase C-terminal domain-containing protein, partial [Deltaproteobacteria bacterium]|nr:aldehyde ferredoxin oxidoreductase C-terminal domain-containing protein [Deltaproteobacteria bacterium]
EHTLAGVKSSCLHCPVTCGRQVDVPGKGRVKGPEYETLALLGSNLGIGTMAAIQQFNFLADDFGMDTISLGGVLGFAMELQQRGMLDAKVAFGDPDGVAELIADIGHRRGLGADLAEGTKRMAEKYGGRDFAIHVKGLELSAYDPRGSYAQGVEYATTNRGGDHTQGASMYMESIGPLTIDPHSLKMKVELPVLMQNLMCSVNSMVLCMFSTYGMVPRQIHALPPSGLLHRMASAVFENSGPLIRMVVRHRPKTGPVLWFEKWLTFITGRPFSLGHLQEIGARIFNLERMYNLREGLTGADDTLPPRLLAEPTFKHQSRGHPLEELLPRYYRLRGWDAGGVPTKETLDELRVQV